MPSPLAPKLMKCLSAIPPHFWPTESGSKGSTKERLESILSQQPGTYSSLEWTFAEWRYPMETLWQDFQFAVRMMHKNLGFTTAAVLCLMLGIGATTGIFTVDNDVLVEALQYTQK